MEKVIKRCDICGKDHYISMSNEQYYKFYQYNRGEALIQELFPELNKVEREFIKSGMCSKCQAEMFGNGKTQKIKEYK